MLLVVRRGHRLHREDPEGRLHDIIKGVVTPYRSPARRIGFMPTCVLFDEFRADMDALSVIEETDLGWTSIRNAKLHEAKTTARRNLGCTRTPAFFVLNARSNTLPALGGAQ